MSRLALIAVLASHLLHAQVAAEWQRWVDAGTSAFSAGNYTEAANAFQKAAYLDANDPATKLYLGAAYMSAWLKERASNRDSAVQAEEQFRHALILQPENDKALLWLGSLMLQLQRLDEAESIYSKAAALVHNERTVCDANYAMGIIIWSRWYVSYSAARRKLGMATSDSGLLPDSDLAKELRNRYGDLIQEGIDRLRSVLSREKGYTNAAAYLGLLYRQRAAISEDRKQYLVNLRIAEDVEADCGPEAAELRSKLETSPALVPPALPALVFLTANEPVK
jgi:tetratricopeptide (TPR) repeat protein